MEIEEALGLVEEIKNCSLPWDDAHWEALGIVINYVKDKLNNSDKSSGFDIQPQPKQEWSEDDVRNIQDIDSVLFYDKNLPEDSCIRLRNWLKSLRPQSQWKPSEEQMIALKSSTYCQNEQMSKVLFELYQDLKNI